MNAVQRQPCILVTNDDGIDAPGIGVLASAVADLGRVVVVAPDRERSAASHALTIHRPLRLRSIEKDRWSVDGTPADCVHLAVPRLTGDLLPDLVLSGINRGLNVGDDVTYSGTVAGALEGALLHIPSIAFSSQTDANGEIDPRRWMPWIRRLAEQTLAHRLADGILLNVNFPRAAPKGVRVTRQGTRRYRATSLERKDPSGRPYYWIDQIDMTPTLEQDGDHRAVEEGFVSVSPLQVNRTHFESMESVREWPLEDVPGE